jgi:hypothetical protein
MEPAIAMASWRPWHCRPKHRSSFSPMAEPQALAWEAPRETVPELVPAPPRGSALGPALAPAPAETVAWLPAPGPAPVVLAGERSAAEPGITQDPGPAVPPPGTVELRSVFLGNAAGVQLAVDGESVPVRPARRDGTARLTVGGGAG